MDKIYNDTSIKLFFTFFFYLLCFIFIYYYIEKYSDNYIFATPIMNILLACILRQGFKNNENWLHAEMEPLSLNFDFKAIKSYKKL